MLGDLLDGGGISWPEDWDRTRRRFDRVFRWPRDPSSATVRPRTGGTWDGMGVLAVLMLDTHARRLSG